MNRSGLYDVSPARVGFDELKDTIETRDQLYLVERRLKRINRADALRPVQVNGLNVPYYLKHEVDIATAQENRRRKAVRDELYPSWENMSQEARQTAQANRNIKPVRPDYSAEGLKEQWSQHAWYNRSKLEKYLNTWDRYSSDHPGYTSTRNIIEDFMKSRQKALYVILESDWDEKEPEYIYPDKTAYAGLPFEVRQSNVVRFWAQKADEYELYKESAYDKVKENRWDEIL